MSELPRLQELESGAGLRVGVAQLLLAQGRHEEAAEESLRALESDPTHAPAHLTLAKALAMQERFEEAERHCAQTLALAGPMSEADELLGHLHYRRGDHAAAEKSFRRACKSNPKAALSWFMRARIRRAAGDRSKARRLLAKALRQESGWGFAWIMLGKWRSEDGLATSAQKALRRALRENPVSPHAHYQLGLIHMQRQEYEQARAEFDAATEANPVIALAAVARGQWLIEQGETRAALDLLGLLARRFEAWAPAHAALGDAHMAAGSAQRALACYDQALVLDASLASAYAKRGLAKVALDRRFDAVLDLQEALQRDPGLGATRITLEELERPRAAAPGEPGALPGRTQIEGRVRGVEAI